MVELSHVTVSYGEKHALNDISLKVNDGEFTFISGDNGAGKSTLIKLLIGDVKADVIEGVDTVVKVNGHDLTTISQRGIPELRRTIGFIFQDFKLIDSMNVFDNVAFVLRSIDASTRYIKKRVPQVIGLMGLQSKVKQFPSELSGGEQQRVAIARALVTNPQLIIADEPTASLDQRAKIETLKLLKEINDKGTTVMVISHEHDLIQRFGGRLVNLRSGVVTHDIHI